MPSMMKAPHSKGANCAMCDGGACKYAEGGHVKEAAVGVHTPSYDDHGKSAAGQALREKDGPVKSIHRQKLAELKDMPKPTSGRSGFAGGGDVEANDDHDGDDMDTELSHGLGKELMSAFESKDHKKLMSSLEACVLHCMSKGDDDV